MPPKARKLEDQIEEVSASPVVTESVSWRTTVSTGSTLLDKALTGNKTRYGGIPGGVLMEIYGDSGLGKTTFLGEIVGNAQRLGGEVRFDDPEARLDPDYCHLMGIVYNQKDFHYPDTVTDVEESIIGPLEEKTVGRSKKWIRNEEKAWRPDPDNINVTAEDSLAALCSQMELEQGDKMGQKKAKDFSQMFRRIARHLKRHNIIMVCSNQIRDNVDSYGPKTKSTGGHAIKFYSSFRIELRLIEKLKRGERTYGKVVEAIVVKNSLDTEWRTAPIRIIFGYGIDDLGANLQWLKENGGFIHPDDPSKKVGYVVAGKNYQSLDAAIKVAEDNNLEGDIREQVIDLWDKLEAAAQPQRKEKVR